MRCVYNQLSLDVCSKGQANDEVEKVLRGLGKEHFRLLLEYVREWNTKSKFCHVAQRLLYTVVSLKPATEIVEVRLADIRHRSTFPLHSRQVVFETKIA